jgi:hypothetical protein
MTQRVQKSVSRQIEPLTHCGRTHLRRHPSFDVEQRPFVRCVLPDCLRQRFVVDIIKRTFLMSELEHDGLKLNRFAAAPSIDSLVSRARYIAERDPKIAKTTPCKVEMGPHTIRKRKI